MSKRIKHRNFLKSTFFQTLIFRDVTWRHQQPRASGSGATFKAWCKQLHLSFMSYVYPMDTIQAGSVEMLFVHTLSSGAPRSHFKLTFDTFLLTSRETNTCSLLPMHIQIWTLPLMCSVCHLLFMHPQRMDIYRILHCLLVHNGWSQLNYVLRRRYIYSTDVADKELPDGCMD
jgi:hypothetical protein